MRRAPLVLLLVAGCGSAPEERAFDPTAYARAHRDVDNLEAAIPPQCYADTRGANPCWVCHTGGFGPNTLEDAELQAEYAFSDLALENPWTNLFVDRRAAVAAISDEEILAWVRQDNYDALRGALADLDGWRGFVPDLDLAAGFDEQGFARDGSGWRAIRYQPFPGFWPANGSTGDVFIRLPERFRGAAYVENLAILERAIHLTDPHVTPELPSHYVGGASDVAVVPLVYPVGTEFLHSVRYLDPDAPGMFATRMKELRWMRKEEDPDAWARLRAYEREADEKEEGWPPRYRGDALEGMVNLFGWRMQGFIEDAEGRLRVQTDQEHRFCMGCHQGLGVTIDSTFSLARKPPGPGGWRPQDLRGLVDRPQVGHAEGELAVYARRLGREVVTIPARADALAMDKAYLAIVRAQSFDRGRDPTIAPATGVHRRIPADAIGAAAEIFLDGRLHLRW